MKRRFSFLIVMLLLILGGIASWWVTAIAPADVSNKTTQRFVIEKGQGIRDIANSLQDQGLIRNSVAFFLLVRQQGIASKIQAGEFTLSPSMTTNQIAKALQVGTFDTRITVPEGSRAEEIADTLQKNLPSYQDSWRETLTAHEGYLFPDTYAFAKDTPIETVVTTMTNNFEKKYASLPQGTRTLSKNDLVTIASMVEREALFPEDRPLVASVILNRLDIGMVLNIDATIQYALGYQPFEQKWWKKHLSHTDLALNSPYNTYINAGLPPTPISNPGKEVMEAVLTAPDSPYLYYVSDSSGHNHYAKTLPEHNANIRTYRLDQ